MVIEDFASKVVYLDTAPLVYFIEGHSIYQPVLASLFDFNDKGGFSFITSAITLLEVLVKPLREEQAGVARIYRDVLTTAPGIEILDFTAAIAEKAAGLRARYNLRTPDAIQLATSIEAGADYFLTNDHRLKVVSETTVVTVTELQ
jgi:predicted nucleic acid-binding protein